MGTGKGSTATQIEAKAPKTARDRIYTFLAQSWEPFLLSRGRHIPLLGLKGPCHVSQYRKCPGTHSCADACKVAFPLDHIRVQTGRADEACKACHYTSIHR